MLWWLLREFLARESHIKVQEGAVRQVERRTHQRVVHGQKAAAIAVDALFVADGLLDRLTQRDAGILDRVVVVDVQVAIGTRGDVDHRVAGQLLHHVVEKAHAGLDVVLAGAVQIDGYADLGFGGVTGDFGASHGPLR